LIKAYLLSTIVQNFHSLGALSGQSRQSIERSNV
jgi:predicted TIM-barrel enzyme